MRHDPRRTPADHRSVRPHAQLRLAREGPGGRGDHQRGVCAARPMRLTCWCSRCWCRSTRCRRPATASRTSRSRCARCKARARHARPSSGSFLGGLFGGGRPVSQPGASSVPLIGSRAAAPLRLPTTRTSSGRGRKVRPSNRPVPWAAADFCARPWRRLRASPAACWPPARIRDMMGGSARQHQCHSTGHQRGTGAAGSRAAMPGKTPDTEQAQRDQEQDALQDASDDDSSWGDSGGDFDV